MAFKVSMTKNYYMGINITPFLHLEMRFSKNLINQCRRMCAELINAFESV